MWQNYRSFYLESRFLGAGGIQSTPWKRKHSALSSFSSTICSKIHTHTQRSVFTFMHLADTFIQSDLHCIQVTVFTFLSALVFIFLCPLYICYKWHLNYNLCIFFIEQFAECTRDSKPLHVIFYPLYHTARAKDKTSILPPSTRRQYFLGKAPGFWEGGNKHYSHFPGKQNRENKK